MAVAKKPFYVSFIHDHIPQQAEIDHSHSNPGPVKGRAGYTSIRNKPRLVILWDNKPIEADGQIPIFAKSVNVYFRLTDFLIAISSDFAVNSCAYKATLRHELKAHIYDPIRIFHSYREVLIRRLNVIAIPTREVPLRIMSGQVKSKQAELESQIVNVIKQTKQELTHNLRQARSHHDSASSYRLVYNQCTDAQWISGK